MLHDILIALAPGVAGLALNVGIALLGKSHTRWGRFFAAWFATAPGLLKKAFEDKSEDA
jgi:hypothetical protein